VKASTVGFTTRGFEMSAGADFLRVRLTPAEHRVLERVMLGETNKEIAIQLECSPRTVEFHLASIFRKAKVNGRGRLMSVVASGRLGVEVR
jgi:DNA-binding CsgD family transcriptional regulator